MSDMYRLHDIISFYNLLEELEKKVGGRRTLEHCDGRMDWPNRGVYFFFEPGERRSTSGEGLRVVRVGTHALKSSSKTKLWKRLRQHRGTLSSGGGNHRGSVFRWHVGTTLMKNPEWDDSVQSSWIKRRGVTKEERQNEKDLEISVSEYIRQMPFLWLEIDDEPGPRSKRGYLERNTIALLSNYNSQNNPIDPPSNEWLGKNATNKKIISSGLWNSNHVDEEYDPGFLDIFQGFIYK